MVVYLTLKHLSLTQIDKSESNADEDNNPLSPMSLKDKTQSPKSRRILPAQAAKRITKTAEPAKGRTKSSQKLL